MDLNKVVYELAEEHIWEYYERYLGMSDEDIRQELKINYDSSIENDISENLTSKEKQEVHYLFTEAVVELADGYRGFIFK